MFCFKTSQWKLCVNWSPSHKSMLSFICAVSVRNWKKDKMILITSFSHCKLFRTFPLLFAFPVSRRVEVLLVRTNKVNTVDGIKEEKKLKKINIFYKKDKSRNETI